MHGIYISNLLYCVNPRSHPLGSKSHAHQVPVPTQSSFLPHPIVNPQVLPLQVQGPRSHLLRSHSHPVRSDILVNCICHGIGLLEIKCPHKTRDEPLTSKNIKYLKEVNGKVNMNENHDYFYQIQSQMGIMNITHYYFFCIYIRWGSPESH